MSQSRRRQAAAQWAQWWDATTVAPTPDEGSLDDTFTLIGRDPGHGLGDAPPSGEAAREILGAALGIPSDQLDSVSSVGAIAALARLNDLVRRLTSAAAMDELTGALRRGAGLSAARREIDRVRRAGGRLVLAVVDVDGLKEVNDTHGHLAGDRLLRDVVTALKAQLRSYDLVVRYGGDEFICVLSEAELGGAELRFREVAFSLAVASGGRSVSVGLAALSKGDRLDDLIARADSALYAGRRRRTRRSRSA